MENLKPKIYPVASPSVAKMLGFEVPDNQEEEEIIESSSVSDLPVADLPIAHERTETDEPKTVSGHDVSELKSGKKSGKTTVNETEALPDLEEQKAGRPLWFKVITAILPYVVVFAVALVLYLFFFGQINFGSVFSGTASKKVETPKETAISALAKQNSQAYYAWISKYYYDVSDPKILDPLKDNSGNGLSNYQKFLLNLNPKSYDTLGLGMSDSEAITQGINPLTGKALTEKQKNIIAEYFDMEVISNRLTLANLQNSSQVAGATTMVGLGPLRNPNYNYIQQNVPQDPNSGAFNGNAVDINTNIPGRLEIPELGINVPIMWTKDPVDFDKDLQSGVVHYPGTALPGQIGTAYISGHSSNVVWAKGEFNKIFAKINTLADNTSFKVTVVQKNGKDAILHYVVTRRQEFLATDQEQFKNSGKSVVALSTCWPVGTTAKRLVVFGELTQISK